MSNIGPNFRPPYQPPPSPGAQSARESSLPPATGNAATPTANMSPEQAPLPAQAALAPLFAFENALAPQQLVVLLRNLLQMPKEIVQLLAMLAQNDPAMGQELLNTLLNEEVPVSLEALQQFMQNQTDKAQDKLLKLLQSSQMSVTGSGKQMGELMSNLSEMVSKAGKSPMDALHTAISLYLPGYPLHPPQAFTMRFEVPQGEEGGQSGSSGDEAQLVLWIETIRLGAWKITITSGGQLPDSTQPPSRWQVWVEHDPIAAPVLSGLQEQVTTAAGGASTVAIAFLSRTSPRPEHSTIQRDERTSDALTQPGGEPSGKQQTVGIHPAGGVSAGILCLAYLLIRVIFELDNREELNQRRASAI